MEAAFLMGETGTQNSVIVALLRVRLNDPSQPITPTALRQHIASRLDLVPSLRWRLTEVPLGLHHPVLEDDPDFDLDHHLRHITIDESQLYAVMTAASIDLIDRSRPLWEMTLLDGLDGGDQGLLCRIHHVLMDGIAFMSTWRRLFGEGVMDGPDAPEAVPFSPQPSSRRALVAAALADQASLWRRFPRLVRDTRAGQRAKAAHDASPVSAATAPAPSARKPLSPGYQPSQDRVMALCDLPLADLRAVRVDSGLTINSIVLGAIGIALRRYLMAHHLPLDPLLTAGVMAASEPPDAPDRQWGNHIGNFIVPMCVDVTDPWAQVNAVSAAATAARTRHELGGLDVQERWLEMIPPFVGIPLVRQQNRRQHKQPTNVRSSFVFSNVRGSADLRFLNASIERLHILGPISDGIGAFVCLCNVRDTGCVSVLANPTALEHPDEFLAALPEIVAELVELAHRHRATS
jgi:diacylglycerol O-acyltransferase